MAERRSRQGGNVFVISPHTDVGRARMSASSPDPNEFPPPVDIHEANGALVISVEVPGVAKEKLRVAVSQNLVLVEGVKENTFTRRRVVYHCMERFYGRFRRVIELPHNANAAAADVWYHNGLLTITVPIADGRDQWQTLAIQHAGEPDDIA